MGSALVQAVANKPKPKIALLNIGVEEMKEMIKSSVLHICLLNAQ